MALADVAVPVTRALRGALARRALSAAT